MKLYVKKIWSLNPIKYEYIILDKAMKDYRIYSISCLDWTFVHGEPVDIKTFEQWLKTEI